MARQFRKRSATITLVLAGSLSGCGSEPIPQQDAYRSLNDCVRDWGNPAQCQPVRDGRYSTSYYYGPSHFGSRNTDGTPKPSANAMDAVTRPKGTQVSSLAPGGGTSSSPGSTSSSSATSRGGFGSSSSAHSSGG
jgi:uncharacterized protein YgiB involved in biofilm formation